MSIHMIIGPMFSGKSQELLRLLDRNTIARRRVFAIKHECDDRGEGRLVLQSRAGRKSEAVSVPLLLPILERAAEFEVVGIDEGQFFADLPEFCDVLAGRGVHVIVAGLDGDYLKRPFGRILELVPLADRVEKLTAICMVCGAEAPYTHRRSNETELVLTGGGEKYEARCRSCV